MESVITNRKQKPELSGPLETPGEESFGSRHARGDAETEQPSLLPLAGGVQSRERQVLSLSIENSRPLD